MSEKTAVIPSLIATIECPLCGEGRLKRTEVLDRLGVRDFARVAQLSAEEAFRLLLGKHKDDQQTVWLRFETGLARRVADLRERHKDELHAAQAAKNDLNRRVEDCLREVGELRERNQELEGLLSKTARRGKLEEISFEEEVRTWAGMWISDKLSRNGDYLIGYRSANGDPVDPKLLIDNKDKAVICESDIDKLVRDGKERSIPVAVLVARSEDQLRQVDRENRWTCKDSVWVLRTTRQWLPRDLDLLKCVFERFRVQGSDFLAKNAALADEVRRSLCDVDRIEGELKKATRAITSASSLVARYRIRLQELCDNAACGQRCQ